MQLPGTSLAIAKQYFREPRTTLRIMENLGIKSPREAPTNERPDGRRPNDESRAEIPEKSRPIDKYGDPQECWREQKRQLVRRRLRKFADHFGASSENAKDTKKVSKGPSRTESPSKYPYRTWLRSRRNQTSNLRRKNERKISGNFGGQKKTKSETLKIGADSSKFLRKSKVFGIHLVK